MKKLPIFIAAVLLVTGRCAFAADNGDGTYTNPILHADFPDTEIIRVGDDFYYQSSSFHFVPGNPIQRSKDLVNWEPAGFSIPDYKILDDARYDLDGHGSAYGIGSWAPSLRYHNGMFYSVCYVWDKRSQNKTGVDGVFLVSRAKSVAGPWKMNAIRYKLYDPGLFFDDDGKVYVFHGQNRLYVTELDADLTKVVTPAKEICNSPSRCEGSHAYKINGMYYLYCPGSNSQHIFRAKNIYGPYEERSACNTMLNFEGSGLHQGGLVQLKNGDWWSVIFQDRGKHGRIPFLFPVHWKDGWPIVEPVLTAAKPDTGAPVQQPKDVCSDEFSSPQLGLQWQWNHHPDPAGWSLTERAGWLRLKPTRVVHALREARNTLAQPVIGPDSSAVVRLDTSGLRDGDIAGLGLLTEHASLIAVRKSGEKKEIVVLRQMSEKGKYGSEVVTSIPLQDNTVILKMEVPYLSYTVEYSCSFDNGASFRNLGGTLAIPLDFFRDWLAPRYSIFCYAEKETGGHADFDFFHLNGPKRSTNLFRIGDTVDAQFCDEYQNMSESAFVWWTDSPDKPNLYLKYPNTSTIGQGIHEATWWAEAFQAKSARWLKFNRVEFAGKSGHLSVFAKGDGKIILHIGGKDGPVLSEIELKDSPDMIEYKLQPDNAPDGVSAITLELLPVPGKNILFRKMIIAG